MLRNRTVEAGWLSSIMPPKRTGHRYPAELKAEVVLAALIGYQPLAELPAHYQLAVAQVTPWKLHL